jgi:hypothetical protein
MTATTTQPAHGAVDEISMNTDALALLQTGEGAGALSVTAVASLNRSEIESQMDAAHRYPRSIDRFLKQAIGLATLTQDVAESCIYTLPRGGKDLTGPSVRLAEIVASAYGNIHVGSRVLDHDAKHVEAQGVGWDIETNFRVTIEVKRRITDRNGETYNDDMITTTGNAAAAIARRNAIFTVVPRAYVNVIYQAARKVAVGDAKTLEFRRTAVMSNYAKLGVTADRVLARVQKTAVEDIGLAELEVLIGIGTSIREGASIEEHFPPGQVTSQGTAAPPAEPKDDGRRISIRSRRGAAAQPPASGHPPPATAEATPQAAQPAVAPASSQGAAAASPPANEPKPSATKPSEPEPPFGSAQQAKPAPSARNWDDDGNAIWNEITAAGSLDALDALTEKVNAFERDGAPQNLMKAIRSHLKDSRGKRGG